jgi:deoxyribodipyrimidine photo-lyase
MAEPALPVPAVPALPAEFIREAEKSWRSAASATGGQAGPLQRCDETAAHQTLNSFLARRGGDYRGGISSPHRSRHTGSRLSVHLAWGTLSLRQVLNALEERKKELRSERDTAEGAVRRELGGWIRSLSAFESRLYWHDHFIQRLEDEPEMEQRPLNRAFEGLHYGGDERLFEAWWEGRTGMPMVDAAIRSLHRTGFVNFRMRALVVSAACHVLHLDWRTIRDPLARIMADYLPGIHVSQLQMQAGVVGINTVRVYNPAKQLIDNDPECRFVHRFIPELRDFDCATIRAWTLATGGSASSIAVERRRNGQMDLFGEPQALGNYPLPLVVYREASAEMKRKLYAIKNSSEGRREAERVLSRHGSRRRRSR